MSGLPEKKDFVVDMKIWISKNFLKNFLKENALKFKQGREMSVGASDIGGCLRKVWLDKKTERNYTVAEMIKMERGNIAEGIVRKMLKNGLKMYEQLELETQIAGFDKVKIILHPDFVIEKPESVLVVEAKSVSTPVESPYYSWILQTVLQMELVEQKFKKEVKGLVVAVDVNTGWYELFPVEKTDVLVKEALKRVEILADCIVNDIEPPAEEQLYCSDCPHKITCPAIVRKDTVTDIPADILEKAQKIKAFSKQEKLVKKEKEQIKTFMEKMGYKQMLSEKEEIIIDFVSRNGRKSFDVKTFQEDNPELDLSKYWKESKGYSFIQIK